MHANVLNCRLAAFWSYNCSYKKAAKRQFKTFACMVYALVRIAHQQQT